MSGLTPITDSRVARNQHHQSPRQNRFTRFAVAVIFACIWIVPGCSKQDPIVKYKIPTKMPKELEPGKDRMLASIVPIGEKVWFFKVTGAEEAIKQVEPTFKKFVQSVQFKDGKPILDELPEGWRRSGEKPMRYASIDVTTDTKQLDISISNLSRPTGEGQEAWNEYVSLNINRWRGQLGLDDSEEKWAGAESVNIAATEDETVWFDQVGVPGGGNKSMTPPFAGGMSAMAGGQGSSPPATSSGSPRSKFKFDRPEGWRDGRKSSMRWAAFNVGPEDSQAEVTVMPAGGDLRGNVARWIGQVRGAPPADDVVDKAMEEASEIDVDGRTAQRFLLHGEDPGKGDAIDAAIVPMRDGVSMFIKMTGPVTTVVQQGDSLAKFLDSIEF